MIEIATGSLEDRIIKVLKKTYPITIDTLQGKILVGRPILQRVLRKLQTRGVIRLEPLPDKTYIRLLRNDFHVIGKKTQQKSVKDQMKKKKPETKQDQDMMYS